MELTHRFTVPAPVDVAWDTFNDLEGIAPCFPGASLTSFDGERFEGICKVKLGPISLQYSGSGRFVERDEATHRAVIEAKGKDKRGNGTASAGITAQLTSAGDDATDVIVTTDLNITGRPAQFGRGVMQDVSDKLLAQFTACVETRLGAGAGSAVGDSGVAAEAVTPISAADLADPVEPADTDTPLAQEAAKAAKATVSTGQPAEAVEPSAKHRAAFDASSATSRVSEQSPPAELDLGSTVVPVLVKRYAPRVVAAVLLLGVLKTMLRRRRG